MVRLASFAALSLACLGANGQFTALTSEIAAIASQVSVLSSAISAFPSARGGSPASAQFIHAKATSLASALTAAVTSASNTGALDDDDATTLIDDIEEFEGDLQVALLDVVVKKPAFDAVGISRTFGRDLASLKSATKEFENAWVPDIPSDLSALATGITSAVDHALQTASAAYN